MIAKIKNFFLEVKAEMNKVTWPSREELVGSTGVVLMTMAILSVFIGITDFIVSIVMTKFLR